MEQKNDNYEHLVYVECMTYNQSNYIEDALRGFVMQRTDFPFVCMIMDDASTDGEQEIIKSFLKQEFDLSTMDRAEDEEAETIIAKHNTNDNCTFVICLLKENHLSTKLDKEHLLCKWRDLSKYIALCEGDDYWTDSRKLQIQYDFLEKNREISLCFHSVKVLKAACNTLVDDFLTRDVPGVSTILDLLKGNYIHTPSVMYRFDNTYSDKIHAMGMTYVGDYPMWMLCAQKGNLYKIEESMAVYRLGSGFWSSKGFSYTYPRWIVMLSKLYPLMDDSVKPAIDQAIEEYVILIERNYRNELDGIKASCSYKIGQALLCPFKFISLLLKRLKGLIINS